MIEHNTIYIYPDGSCLGNNIKNIQSPGGYGSVLIYNNSYKEISGGEPNTTNNRMELLSIIKSLEFLKDENRNIVINTDSMYVINGITKWIDTWISKNWKNIKNKDLWEQLYILNKKHNIQWVHVKGHSGHKYNEIANTLAITAATKFK